MRKFDTITSKAVAMLEPDVDTDIIAPLESLTTDKSIADVAFAALRYIDGDTDRRIPNPDFFLNQPANDGAKIMLTGENYGCGSSREMAAQSFKDLGFRCLIGSSFGDIFYDNCFQQDVLAIVLPKDKVEQIAAQIYDGEITVDLVSQKITLPDGAFVAFEVDEWRRESLLKGLDMITLSLTKRDKIKAFQRQDKAKRPWVYQTRFAQ